MRTDQEVLTRRQLLRVSLAATTFLLAACTGAVASKSTNSSSPAAATPMPLVPASATSVGTTAAPVTPVATTTAPSAPVATTMASSAQTLSPTVSSVDANDVTPSLTEGPYFKPNSPERTSLVDATTAGTKLTLTGRVLSTRAQPIARALLDFWQANAQGSYDNSGYLLRGHQFADAEGTYQLVTVIPGLYPGRTRHIHVKVQAPNQPALTTQLFFPNEPQNQSDSIFSPKLVLPIQDAPDGAKTAAFNFVLNVGSS